MKADAAVVDGVAAIGQPQGCCAFTCTVSAEQTDDLARGNFHGHPERNVAQSIIGKDIIDFIDRTGSIGQRANRPNRLNQ